MLEIARRFNRFLIVVGITVALSGCLTVSDTTLRVGEQAPSLKTKTLADVDGDFSRITTYRYPDERMYQYSIDEALTQGKPVIVEFATPGHCTVDQKVVFKRAGRLLYNEIDIALQPLLAAQS